MCACVCLCDACAPQKRKKTQAKGTILYAESLCFLFSNAKEMGGFRGLDPHDPVKIKAMTKEALHFRRHKKGAMQIVLIWHLGAEIVAMNAVFFF